MKWMALLFLLLFPLSAQAGTLTITASGFANTPSATPSNWPANVTWPGSQSPNGTKTYTVNDADWIALMTWVAASQYSGSVSPTAAQILLAWLQIWVNGTKTAIQQYLTVPAQPPTPISIQ